MSSLVALWVDHHEAVALGLDPTSAHFTELARVKGHDAHTHSKKGGGHRHPADARYLGELTGVVAAAEHVVLTGPGEAKDELVAHIEKTRPELRTRIAAVEKMDHATEGQIAAHARLAFERMGRMQGIHVAPARR